MAQPTAPQWSQGVKDNSKRGKSTPSGSTVSVSTFTFYTNHAAAQLQPHDKTQLEKAKDGLRDMCPRPASGRTTALGRKVEKPGPERQGGPSGQTDGSKHDGTHTNK